MDIILCLMILCAGRKKLQIITLLNYLSIADDFCGHRYKSSYHTVILRVHDKEPECPKKVTMNIIYT